MKLTNLVLLFVLIAWTAMVPIQHKTETAAAKSWEDLLFHQRFDSAIDDSMFRMVEADGGQFIGSSKEDCAQSFYRSLYANFAILHDTNQQNRLRSCLPVLLYISRDGFYIRRLMVHPNKELQEIWSTIVPYEWVKEGCRYRFSLGDAREYVMVTDLRNGTMREGYRQDLWEHYQYPMLVNEELFDKVRRAAIVELLKTEMQKAINEYNQTVANLGIAYEFTLPVIPKEDWYRTIDDMGLLAVFQCYPYAFGNQQTYERYLLAGARSHKRTE